jgi:hypothetical protein
MKNTATKESNTINLGQIEIFEPELESERNVTLRIQIPYRSYLYGRRTMTDYKETTLEILRVNASLNFKLVRFLSRLLNTAEYDFNSAELGEYINFVGGIGGGLLEASEIAEMEFERYEKAKNAENQET